MASHLAPNCQNERKSTRNQAVNEEMRWPPNSKPQPATAAPPSARHADDHDNRPGVLRGRGQRLRYGDGSAPDQGLRRRLRADVLRPCVHQHGLLPLGDHLHRRRGRILQHRGYPINSLRALELLEALPAGLRRAPTQPCSSAGSSTSPTTPSSTRTSSSSSRVPLRRSSDGHAARRGRGAVHLYPDASTSTIPRSATWRRSG